MEDGFAKDLRDFNRTVRRDATRNFRRLGFKAFETIVRRTPRLTGCARGNWRVSFDGLTRDFDAKRLDFQGNATIAAANARIASAELGVDMYLENSTPYISPLENGYSRQAPNGMVGITKTELQKAVDAGAF